MTRAFLFTVEATGLFEKPGTRILALAPKFPIPEKWRNRSEIVLVVRPDLRELEAEAEIGVSHINIRDPEAPIEARWKLTMCLTDRTPEDVPVGSRIFVSPALHDAIYPGLAG